MIPASGATSMGSRWMLPTLCSAAFLVFAQTFMVAPLIPRLSTLLGASTDAVGLAIPAYVIPQALSILFVGPFSDRMGRKIVILGSLSLFCALTLATATATDVTSFIRWRLATGVVAAGIVPISLTLIGDVIPYQDRGRAVGWLFGAIAGGTAAGAAAGALLEPLLGWQGLFLCVGALCLLVLLTAISASVIPHSARHNAPAPWSATLKGYRALLTQLRALRTYGYVLLNAILQSGVFTWLGVYLHARFGLDEAHIGLALLGYGIPGLIFGPLIGKLADRCGRARIIPLGVALTGLCTLSLIPSLPLVLVQVAIIFLSLGFDLTQPLLAGIATSLKGAAKGQAVALMAFSLFSGFGLGSLLFQAALKLGFASALSTFGVIALIAAIVAWSLFRSEVPVPGLSPVPSPQPPHDADAQ
ncbi:MAG TPA: MFS transporter [Castellaniella sp.]|uniref:MFS transporter n=1 Tax=Castellaniella sp. TaxID=1955812 RepID=UPI002F0CFC57